MSQASGAYPAYVTRSTPALASFRRLSNAPYNASTVRRCAMEKNVRSLSSLGQFSYSDVFRGHACSISVDRHVSSIRYVHLFTPSLGWVPWPPHLPWPCGSPSSLVLWAHTIPHNPSSAVSGCPRPPTTSSGGDCEAFPSSWRIPLEACPGLETPAARNNLAYRSSRFSLRPK